LRELREALNARKAHEKTARLEGAAKRLTKAELEKKSMSERILSKILSDAIMKLATSGESVILKVVGVVLRMQQININFMKLIIDTLNIYQEFFQVEPNKTQSSPPNFEAYRKFYVHPDMLDKFLQYVETERYLFFPGLLSATKDRKAMLNLAGNILLNIKVEPDYVYQCYTLFSEKASAKAPKLIEPDSDFRFKQEVLFPVFYPFKVMAIKRVGSIYEIFCICPNVFHYNDHAISMLNQEVVVDQGDDSNTEDLMETVIENASLVNSFIKFCPLKLKRQELTYEIDFMDTY
jgi:hypothetical protein